MCYETVVFTRQQHTATVLCESMEMCTDNNNIIIACMRRFYKICFRRDALRATLRDSRYDSPIITITNEIKNIILGTRTTVPFLVVEIENLNNEIFPRIGISVVLGTNSFTFPHPKHDPNPVVWSSSACIGRWENSEFSKTFLPIDPLQHPSNPPTKSILESFSTQKHNA